MANQLKRQPVRDALLSSLNGEFRRRADRLAASLFDLFLGRLRELVRGNRDAAAVSSPLPRILTSSFLLLDQAKLLVIVNADLGDVLLGSDRRQYGSG